MSGTVCGCKEYYIAYNPVDDCVQYCERKMQWGNAIRAWDGFGERGLIHPNSGWASHRGGPMQVWLSEKDKY